MSLIATRWYPSNVPALIWWWSAGVDSIDSAELQVEWNPPDRVVFPATSPLECYFFFLWPDLAPRFFVDSVDLAVVPVQDLTINGMGFAGCRTRNPRPTLFETEITIKWT